MTCEETQDLLHGYIDDELDLLRNIEIERHLNEYQTCLLARQDQFALRSAISESALYFAAPARLQQRVKNALRAESKTEFAPSVISRHWLAVAASLVSPGQLALRGFPPGNNELAHSLPISTSRRTQAECTAYFKIV